MSKIIINSFGRFGLNQSRDFAVFELRSKETKYEFAIPVDGLHTLASALSEFAHFVSEQTDATEGSAEVHALETKEAKAAPSLTRDGIVLSIQVQNGQRYNFDLPSAASKSLREEMADAERYTAGDLGQTKQ